MQEGHHPPSSLQPHPAQGLPSTERSIHPAPSCPVPPRPPCRGAQGSRHAEPRSSVTFLGWCFCVPRWVRGRVGLYCGWEAELDVQIWLGGSWTQYFWQGCSLTSSPPHPPHLTGGAGRGPGRSQHCQAGGGQQQTRRRGWENPSVPLVAVCDPESVNKCFLFFP